MVTFSNRDIQLGYIAGKYAMSGGCTSVVGGTMTAGTADSAGSALITFAPAFVSAPVINLTYEGFGANTGNIVVAQLTGVTVSNAYIAIGTTPASGGNVHVLAIGLQKL